MGEGQPRLLDQVRDRIRRKHYSIRTEQAYVDWIRGFVLHHNKRHSRDMGVAEVEGFLTHRAVAKHVSASTKNQAKRDLVPLQGGPRGDACVARRRRVGEAAGVPAGGPDAPGGRIDPGTSERHGGIDDPAPLRDRHADHGMCGSAMKHVDFARGKIAVRQGKARRTA
jgi:Phage integrase, N-terminal SAM-like domain